MQHFLPSLIFSLLASASIINQTLPDPSTTISYTSQYSQTNQLTSPSLNYSQSFWKLTGDISQNQQKIGNFSQSGYRQTLSSNLDKGQYMPILQNYQQLSNQQEVQEFLLSVRSLLNPVPYYQISFRKFIEQFDKKYLTDEEYRYRNLVYHRNCMEINKFNLNDQRFFNMGLNQFADLEESQFSLTHATLLPQSFEAFDTNRLLQFNNSDSNITEINALPPNLTVSWKCFTGPIAHQGFCGSCYAFSCADAVATLYTLYDPHTNFHMRLSVQELISCNVPILQDGCKGGLFSHTYQYIKNNGITTELNYPYSSAFSLQPPPCDTKKSNSPGKRKITDYKRIIPECIQILKVLIDQPLAVGISSLKLQFYSEGVFEQSANSFTDHAVLLIGYDEIKGFEIKNMWGRTWGLLGYGWVSYSRNAGICSRAYSLSLPQEMGNTKNECL